MRQHGIALEPGCTPPKALDALTLPVVLNLAGYVVGTLVLSPIADTIGRRNMLLITMLITGAGSLYNALAPGYFPTELTGFLTDPAFAQSIRDRTLLGRTPEAGELDGPLLFLATGASSYMTGQVLVIDGGWTAV